MRSPDPIVAELAARRARLRVSKEALARESGVSAMTIRRLERGDHDPCLHTVNAIARALGMRVCLRPEVGDA